MRTFPFPSKSKFLHAHGVRIELFLDQDMELR